MNTSKYTIVTCILKKNLQFEITNLNPNTVVFKWWWVDWGMSVDIPEVILDYSASVNCFFRVSS